ncbi:unnamed protein product [Rhizoctonia solani]|uniref:hydroxyacylglutathione hydrolase n=1 Tax=Rhizoctonia solani TaxID=456999 RepID=A0A8H3E4W0_9AGAM|nr:unnamed protein product [Rhizoctonia solani]
MRIITVPVRRDNYAYLLIDEATNKAAAVDPFDVLKCRAQAEKEGVELIAVITTHHHAGMRTPQLRLYHPLPNKTAYIYHSGGNDEFHSAYPNALVYGGSDSIPALTHLAKDGDIFYVGENIQVRCLATPCHTRDSICYYVLDTARPEQKGVFTGQAITGNGIFQTR